MKMALCERQRIAEKETTLVEEAKQVDGTNMAGPAAPNASPLTADMIKSWVTEEEEPSKRCGRAQRSSEVRTEDWLYPDEGEAKEVLKFLQKYYLLSGTGSGSAAKAVKRMTKICDKDAFKLESEDEWSLLNNLREGWREILLTTSTPDHESDASVDSLGSWVRKGLVAFEKEHIPILKAGKGVDGRVYYVIRKKDYNQTHGYEENLARVCAAKFSTTLNDELAVLKCLPKHPRLIELLEHEQVQPGNERWLTMSAVTGGTFWSFRQQWANAGARVPESLTCHVIAQLGEALAFLHGFKLTAHNLPVRDDRRGICHRDLHFSNVMMAPTFTDSGVWPDMKIIDFSRALVEPPHDRQHREASRNYDVGVRVDWFQFIELVHRTAYNCTAYDKTLGCCDPESCVLSTRGYFFGCKDEWFHKWAAQLGPRSCYEVNERNVLSSLVRQSRNRRKNLEWKQVPHSDYYARLFYNPISEGLLDAAARRSEQPSVGPRCARGPPMSLAEELEETSLGHLD